MQFSTGVLGSFGKARRSRFGLGSALLVFTIGALFTGVSFLLLHSEFQSHDWPSTEGRVVYVSERLDSENGMMYTPTIAYRVNGATYKVTSSQSSGSRDIIGSQKTVRYNPQTPQVGIVALSGAGYMIFLFPIIGIVLMIGAVAGLIFSFKRGASISRLKQTGTKLRGVVTNVENVSQGGVIRVIVSAADQSGQVRDYKSDSIGGNTFSLMNYRTNPVAMDVYVDGSNPNNYYVDIADVPAMTVESIQQLLMQATGKQPFGSTPAVAVVQPQPAPQTATADMQNTSSTLPPLQR